NLQTRQKIIDCALAEFSVKSYGEASLNTICAAGNLSKGIIYHYFKDKDALYLVCVQACFDALTAYLGSTVAVENLPIEQGLNHYFDARIAFFAANPLYLGVFCSAIMNPPAHLSAAIGDITAAFHAQAVSILTALLGSAKLRADSTIAEVVEVFCAYQDFVNTRFQMKTVGETTLNEHEQRCCRSLQILLYGVMERDGKHDVTKK
ncbi:MAG: TetR/AcrR family transcriptional regulator, partial [Gemmiger sp.]|nr:TetR/AcrR family transcriptional regulator [Gemmiger sp.]